MVNNASNRDLAPAEAHQELDMTAQGTVSLIILAAVVAAVVVILGLSMQGGVASGGY